VHVLAFLSSHVGHSLSIFFAPTPSNFAIALTLRFVDNRLLSFPLSILPAPKKIQKRKKNKIVKKTSQSAFCKSLVHFRCACFKSVINLRLSGSSISRGLDFCDAISSIASERERSPQLHPLPRSMDENFTNSSMHIHLYFSSVVFVPANFF
jgi:hypothetical protein